MVGRKRKLNYIKQSYVYALLLFTIISFQSFSQTNRTKAIEGFSFKVQISASYNKQESIPELQAKYNITDEIIEIPDRNNFKYAVGNYATYQEAATYRDQFISKTGNKKAFIIAVKNGVIQTNWNRNDIGSVITEKTEIEQTKLKVDSSEFLSDTIEEAVLNQPDTILQESLEITPAGSQGNYDPFPLNLIQHISDYIEINFTSSRVIILAVILIITFLFTFFLLIIIIFIWNLIRNRQEKRIEKYRDHYQNILTQFLFSEDAEGAIPHELHGSKNKLEKEALIQEMLILHKTLSGETKKTIQTLYLELALHSFSMKKLESRKWHIKAQGINELSRLNIGSSTNSIERMLISKNEIIRMEAQCAIVNLHKNYPFSFLDHLKYPLTEWEKLNIHYLAENSKAKIPEFKKWLNSDNDSLLIFCLQMIALYKQNNAIDDIRKLFNHPNDLVRKAAYKTSERLGVDSMSPDLIAKFADEETENRIRIIKALGTMSSYSNLDFMENKLLEETDFDIRLKLASSIKKYGSKGSVLLAKYASSEDNDLKRIINHIIDQRI